MKRIKRAIWRTRLIGRRTNMLAMLAFVSALILYFLFFRPGGPIENIPGTIISVGAANNLAVVRTRSGEQIAVNLEGRRNCRVGDAVTVDRVRALLRRPSVTRLGPQSCQPKS